ncbi:MAG: autotransporter outer membrane beta-barrel domain-containing protein [Rhodocyclales bacterium]|nr:autotransporter outer membrane beta-barrel domain-containing protein [Rhodocyclales bacterium]
MGGVLGSLGGGGGGGLGGGFAPSGGTVIGPTSSLPAGVTRFALPGQGGTGAAGAPGGKAVNAWFAVARNSISYDYAPLQSAGNVRVGLLGVDYTFNNNIVAGLAIAGDKTDVNLNFGAGGKVKGSGTTYSPYVAIPLNRNWATDLSVGWGKTKINNEFGGFSGQLTDNRRTASLGMTYRQLAGSDNKWMLTGRGSYLAVKDKLGAYTMSNGTFTSAVAGSDVTVSQLRFGGQAAYNAGAFVPYAGLNYIYDLKEPNQAGAANDRDAFQAVLGLKFSIPSGFYGGLQYSSELNRSQIKNNQLMLNMGARF